MADEKRRKLLLTRPRADAEELAAALLERDNISCIIAPMLEIIPARAAVNEISHIMDSRHPPPTAAIITSRHALPALSAVKPCLSLPLFVVGRHTAEQAARLGFTAIQPAADNASSLVERIAQTASAKHRSFIYAAGEHLTTDIKSILQQRGGGHIVHQVTVYRAQAATALPTQAVAAISNGEIYGVSFYSRRTVEIFAKLVAESGLTVHMEPLTAFCLSDNIASRACELLPWREVRNTIYQP